jgi:hypothetical protein
MAAPEGNVRGARRTADGGGAVSSRGVRRTVAMNTTPATYSFSTSRGVVFTSSLQSLVYKCDDVFLGMRGMHFRAGETHFEHFKSNILNFRFNTSTSV